MRITALHSICLLTLGVTFCGVAGGQGPAASVPSVAKTAMVSTQTFPESDRRFLRIGAIAATAGGDATAEHGSDLYKAKCAMCHGPERAGMVPVFPSLVDVTKRLSDADIASQIKNGKGKMPPVPDMSDDDIASVILFLKTPVKAQ